MRLIDSNIIIYSVQDEYAHLRSIIKSPGSFTCQISYIEVLGYHKITDEEKHYFKSVFVIMPILPLTEEIMLKATDIRQQRKYSLGDSVIAATALIHGLELYPRNTDDFKHIKGLNLNNPCDFQAHPVTHSPPLQVTHSPPPQVSSSPSLPYSTLHTLLSRHHIASPKAETRCHTPHQAAIMAMPPRP